MQLGRGLTSSREKEAQGSAVPKPSSIRFTENKCIMWGEKLQGDDEHWKCPQKWKMEAVLLKGICLHSVSSSGAGRPFVNGSHVMTAPSEGHSWSFLDR